ncbi:MAG: hypothetical protein ACLP50_35725 [Solirubrobacteraceae bacterium]
MPRIPDIELLWCDGCPSTERALADLRSVLSELALDGALITLREIRTDQEALAERFVGSPTILVDGSDVAPGAAGEEGDEEPPGLSCRVYRRRDGRVAPTPDPLDLREALAAASEREEVDR